MNYPRKRKQEFSIFCENHKIFLPFHSEKAYPSFLPTNIRKTFQYLPKMRTIGDGYVKSRFCGETSAFGEKERSLVEKEMFYIDFEKTENTQLARILRDEISRSNQYRFEYQYYMVWSKKLLDFFEEEVFEAIKEAARSDARVQMPEDAVSFIQKLILESHNRNVSRIQKGDSKGRIIEKSNMEWWDVAPSIAQPARSHLRAKYCPPKSDKMKKVKKDANNFARNFHRRCTVEENGSRGSDITSLGHEPDAFAPLNGKPRRAICCGGEWYVSTADAVNALTVWCGAGAWKHNLNNEEFRLGVAPDQIDCRMHIDSSDQSSLDIVHEALGLDTSGDVYLYKVGSLWGIAHNLKN